MGTPVEWLSEFQVNFEEGPTGSYQEAPIAIGLSNGNILVAWKDYGDLFAPSAGSDLVGKIYDASGHLVRDSFQLNTAFSDGNEVSFKIAATNDGGFVLIYRAFDISPSDNSDLHWERHDAAGDRTHFATLESETSSTQHFYGAELTVNQLTNETVVTYTHQHQPFLSTDNDAIGRSVSSTGTVGSAFDVANNATGDSYNQSVAFLTDGNIVSVSYHDAASDRLQFKIMTSAGATVKNPTTIASSLDGTANGTTDVTTLANGGFVVSWNENGRVWYEVFDNAGSSLVGMFTVHPVAFLLDLVALPDGDFVVVYQANDRVEGKRYNVDGSQEGITFVISDSPQSQVQSSITGDGRLLFTWNNPNALALFASIWDTRPSVDASDYELDQTNFVNSDVVTHSPNGSTIDARTDGADDNTLYSGPFTGSLFGGGGNDTFIFHESPLKFSGVIIDGGSGTDTIALHGSGLHDFVTAPSSSPATITSIEAIDFAGLDNTVSRSANFSAGQIGSGELSSSAVLHGSAAAGVTNIFTVILSAQDPSVNLSQLSFTNWGPDGDLVRVVGDSSNNNITGSSEKDELLGNGGNDTFFINTGDIASGEIIDGGADTDTLLLQGTSTHALALATLNSIEVISFIDVGIIAHDRSASLHSGQFGAGISFNALIDGNSNAGITDSLQIALTTANLDLSNLTFTDWGEGGDFISINGSFGANTITGSSGKDIIIGNGGNDKLFGEGGDDRFEFQASDLHSGVVVKGGTGTDAVLLRANGDYHFDQLSSFSSI